MIIGLLVFLIVNDVTVFPDLSYQVVDYIVINSERGIYDATSDSSRFVTCKHGLFECV